MEFNYNKESTDVNEILHSAQLLVDAFARTIEENNCLNILPITLHQNIVNAAKDLDNAYQLSNNPTSTTSNTNKAGDILNSVKDSVQQHKNSCFSCKLSMPDINFNFDYKAAFNKLKGYIDLQKGSLNKLDLCQVGFSLQSNCLPDIIKLIVIILTAYLTIMSIKLLSNFSISVFIKGVISKLFQLLIGSFKISIDIGATNISCLINAMKEIALSIPTAETVANQLNDDQKAQLGLSEIQNKTVSNFTKGLDNMGSNINSTTDSTVDNINKAFDVITNTIDASLSDIKDHIDSLLGLKNIMQGEDIRLGIDITSLFTQVNNMIQVLNLLSSIALSLAKQKEREKMCKTNNTINNLTKNEVNNNFNKDVVQEYNKKVTNINKSDDKVIGLLIHDKPVDDGLPKIDLYDCSIDDFIEAHTIDNIVSTARDQVNKELNNDPDYSINSNITSNAYTILRPDGDTEDLIKNLVDLIYINPNKDVDNTDTTTNSSTSTDNNNTTSTLDNIINPLGSFDLFGEVSDNLKDTISGKDNNDTSLKCKSVEDVLDILNSIKR